MRKCLLCGLCLTVMTLTNSVQAFEVSKPSLNTLKQVAQPQATQAQTDTTFNPSGTIGHINSQLYAIDSEVQAAYDSLFSALLSKEDYNKYKAELQTIQDNKSLSESEKRAKLAEVATDTSAILANEEKQSEISENLKTLSDAKKTEYANALVSLTNAGFQYAGLAQDCKSLSMRIASNPVQAAGLALELGQVKDTAALLKSNLKSIKNVTTQVVAINKANGIEVKLPENKAGKAKKIEF